jgi:release factor glutamine methyltransferase
MQPAKLNLSRVRALLAEAEARLSRGPHPERARLDAEAMLLYIFRSIDPDRNRAWLVAHANDPTSSDTRAHFKVLLVRRLRGEPIQYITGETEFYGLPFGVTPDVLIPRPETEHLVERVIALASEFPSPRILDIGTGSGAIAIALAHKIPSALVTAIDISESALSIAHQNAARNGVAGRVRFLQGDLLAPVAGEQFDFIVSNPPYVPGSDRDSLAVEVRDHEPSLALFAGNDGLDIYRRLIPAAFASLVPDGFIALEIGFGQQAPVRDLLASAGFRNTEFHPDLQSIPRVALATK